MSEHGAAHALLVYEGVVIRQRGLMWHGTDMWRAVGSIEGKRPHDWMRLPSTSGFIDYMETDAGFSRIELVQTFKGGSEQGTYLHRRLAVTYARYLSDKFHLWCNDQLIGMMDRPTGGGSLATIERSLASTAAAAQALVTGHAALRSEVKTGFGEVKREFRVVHSTMEEHGQRLSRVERDVKRATRRRKDAPGWVYINHGRVLHWCFDGKCQVCPPHKRAVIVDVNGCLTADAQLDHWRDVDNPSFHKTMVICDSCNNNLSSGVYDRNEYNVAFYNYQAAAKRFFAENPHLSAEPKKSAKFKEGPEPKDDQRQASIILPFGTASP